MPTYEYLCKACGNAFEADQAITAAPLKKCPKCGKAVERLISGGVGILHGKGMDHGPACSTGGDCGGPATPCGGCCGHNH